MKFVKWLDERTGFATAFNNLRRMQSPAGRFCCRALPVSIVFLFLLQAITGAFLWAFYSPSATSAWESVFYIQYVLPCGWLVRGVHHYSAQLIVGLTGFYVFALIIHGACRRPREFVYWSALVLFLLSLCSCLTGDLLPWSQSGYFATLTRVSFLQLIPGIGVALYQIVVGGPDPQFGTLTLTRFLFLHVCVFGGGGILVLCFWKFFDIRSRKLLRTEERFENTHKCCLACAEKKTRSFWSRDAFLTGLTCVVVLAAVLVLAQQKSLTDKQIASRAPTAPAESYLGAELTAPVDVSTSFDAARPEWSFRGLYTMTKLPIFSKIGMVYAIFVVPPLIVFFFFLIPILSRSKSGYCFCVLATLLIAVVAVKFTYDSYYDDYSPSSEHSAGFLAGMADAERTAERAVELAFAPAGIPKSGALELLKADPYLQGPKLFNQHCASCHNFTPKEGDVVNSEYVPVVCEEPTAPNLYGAQGTGWIKGFTTKETLTDVDCFGATAFAKSGSMIGFLNGRVQGGIYEKDGSFILNSSDGLIAKVIAADASPAVDVLESVYEDFCDDEDNMALVEKALNEDDEFEDDEVEAAQNAYVAKLIELVEAKFADAEFIAELDPKLPEPVLTALREVLLETLRNEDYKELLLDEDNLSLIKDDSAEDFITDSYLAKLNGDDEPIPPEEQKYVNMLRNGILAACDEMANALAEEAKLDAPRPFVDGEYLGLAPNVISDMEFLTCTQCHAFYGTENDHACDLRAYMSRDWIAGFIADPTSTKYYGQKNDRMPSYLPEEGDALMTQAEVDALADWLAGKWYRAPEVINDSRYGVKWAAQDASATQESVRVKDAAIERRLQEELDAKIAKEKEEREAAEAQAQKEKEEKAKRLADEKAKKEAAEKAKLAQDLAEAREALKNATNAASDAANEASNAIADVEKERDAAKDASAALQSEIDALKAEMKTAVDQANKATQAAQQRAAQVASELETQKSNAENARRQMTEDHLKALQLQKEASDQRIKEAQDAASRADQGRQVAEQRVNELNDALQKALNEANDLRSQLNAETNADGKE